MSDGSELTAWRQVCALVSGAALMPTVATLRRAGALDRLVAASAPVPIADLADACDLHEGYAHVGLGLLGTQGLLERTLQGEDTRRARVSLTAEGHAWAARSSVYDGVTSRIAAARGIRAGLLHDSTAASCIAESLPPADDGLGARLRLHARGPVVASIVGALGRLGALRRLYKAPLGWLGRDELGVPGAALDHSLPILEDLGWVRREDDLIALTPEGRGAARWAPLFNYVYGYLGVYERAVSLLRSEAAGSLERDEGRDDADRDLLLTGKAYVFRTGLRAPLEALLRDVFTDSPPRVVVDMNAGDGVVLTAVAQWARAWNTADDLSLVALVRNPLAEARCKAALAATDLPHRVLRTDFSDPDEVARALAGEGLALSDALVLSKTTIHDRRYIGTHGVTLGERRGQPSRAPFISPEGQWIDPVAMEDDLAAFFARWRRHLGLHGMIAMDTHTVDASVAARTWPENVVTHIAASHGYSSQYLIECDRFREAARRGGLSSRFQLDLGTDRVEAVTMSLDHFVE